MANTYSIELSDVTPRRIPAARWLELTDDDGDGTPDVTLADAIALAEERFHGATGGALTAAAGIAQARPHVLAVLVYVVHERRAQFDGAAVPPAVQAAYAKAMAWAEDAGAALCAAETGAAAPGSKAGAQATGPAEQYGMTDLQRL